MLFDNGYLCYRGIDFSEAAIKTAKEVNGDRSDLFSVENVFTTDLLDGEYDVVVLFEILEHLQGDLQVLDRIKGNKKVLFSVPNFTDPNHVRYFTNEQDIKKRYSPKLDILDICITELGKGNKLFTVAEVKK